MFNIINFLNLIFIEYFNNLYRLKMYEYHLRGLNAIEHLFGKFISDEMCVKN